VTILHVVVSPSRSSLLGETFFKLMSFGSYSARDGIIYGNEWQSMDWGLRGVVTSHKPS